MGVAAHDGLDGVLRRDVPELVPGVAQRAVGTVLQGQSGHVVLEGDVQPRRCGTDVPAGFLGVGVELRHPVQKEVGVGQIPVKPRFQRFHHLFGIPSAVGGGGAAAEAAGPGVLLVGGVVVTAEDEIFDVQPLRLFPEPAQIGREILRLEADADVELVGIFLPQPAQGQDVIVQLGGQHPDAADEARRRVGPGGVVRKPQHLEAAAQGREDVFLLGAFGVAAAGGVGVVIGQHDRAPSRAEIF